ncbi:prophenoloxidase activating enzyme [Penaeus vannamei]|uniref:Prophenoloxidase activating enzyme n=1 Tax=Penaeus vannamei TaxID=6689 RepID=A0A3R7NEX2_PENVA|nr:prophenoloxidase activating enzyme [Penaeus vannamei]
MWTLRTNAHSRPQRTKLSDQKADRLLCRCKFLVHRILAPAAATGGCAGRPDQGCGAVPLDMLNNLSAVRKIPLPQSQMVGCPVVSASGSPAQPVARTAMKGVTVALWVCVVAWAAAAVGDEQVSRKKREPQQPGFNFGPDGSFRPSNNPGFNPGGPDCTGNRRNSRRCQNRPTGGQVVGQGGGGVSSAFQQIPWLSQLSSDQRNLLIPNLPKTPSRGAQSRFFLLGTGKPDVPFQQCVTPKFERGHCRYLQHCIQPEFVNNFNVFLRYVCFIEGVYVGVCCPDTFNNNNVTPPPPPTTPRPTTPRPVTPPSQSRGCGLIAKRPPTRIVGGKDADPQEWPWMAALMRDGASSYCGGVLITDSHVLTAAHCVDGFDRNTITVRLGEYTFDRADDTGHVDFRVADIRMHSSYDTTTYVNDIAIIKLQGSTNFNVDIWPVCLPEGDESYEGRTGTVTGTRLNLAAPCGRTSTHIRGCTAVLPRHSRHHSRGCTGVLPRHSRHHTQGCTGALPRHSRHHSQAARRPSEALSTSQPRLHGRPSEALSTSQPRLHGRPFRGTLDITAEAARASFRGSTSQPRLHGRPSEALSTSQPRLHGRPSEALSTSHKAARAPFRGTLDITAEAARASFRGTLDITPKAARAPFRGTLDITAEAARASFRGTLDITAEAASSEALSTSHPRLHGRPSEALSTSQPRLPEAARASFRGTLDITAEAARASFRGTLDITAEAARASFRGTLDITAGFTGVLPRHSRHHSRGCTGVLPRHSRHHSRGCTGSFRGTLDITAEAARASFRGTLDITGHDITGAPSRHSRHHSRGCTGVLPRHSRHHSLHRHSTSQPRLHGRPSEALSTSQAARAPFRGTLDITAEAARASFRGTLDITAKAARASFRGTLDITAEAARATFFWPCDVNLTQVKHHKLFTCYCSSVVVTSDWLVRLFGAVRKERNVILLPWYIGCVRKARKPGGGG